MNLTIIKRHECPEHGPQNLASETCGKWPSCTLRCVERTYVAVDALLSDKAIDAAYEFTNPGYTETGEYRDVAEDAIRAAIEAVSSGGS